jgi:hypothetical protein
MKRLILTTCLFVLFASCTALADWNVGDSYKMHFPQLPDPEGWDVEFYAWVPQLADDWQCTESGYVDDVHIWYSWEDDLVGDIVNVQLGIWSNAPEGPDGDFSKPDELVWGYQDLSPGQFTTRPWSDVKEQGWYNPVTGFNNPSDHNNTYQLNVVDIVEPFYQQEDEIYWLSVCFWLSEDLNNASANASAGWKTADVDNYPENPGEHFMDDAVWWDGNNWNELRDPLDPEVSLDLAFVITPEPATISLLVLGSLVLLRKRRA